MVAIYSCYSEKNKLYNRTIIFIKFNDDDMYVIFINKTIRLNNIIYFNIPYNKLKNYKNLYLYYIISIILTPSIKKLKKYNIDTNLKVFSKQIKYNNNKISISKCYIKQYKFEYIPYNKKIINNENILNKYIDKYEKKFINNLLIYYNYLVENQIKHITVSLYNIEKKITKHLKYKIFITKVLPNHFPKEILNNIFKHII